MKKCARVTNKHCASGTKFPIWISDIEESVKSRAFTKDFVVMKWHLDLLGKKIAYLSFTQPRKNFAVHNLYSNMSSRKNFCFCNVQPIMLVCNVTLKEKKRYSSDYGAYLVLIEQFVE